MAARHRPARDERGRGLPLAGGDPQRHRRRDGRRSPSSPPADSAPTEREISTISPAASPTPTPTPDAVEPTPSPKPTKPTVDRGKVYVEVYNNSGVTGLAGRVAAQASQTGWQVVGSDNWYGTIPASTVYYPPRLERPAKLLALDLGIQRTAPAVDPMRLDRLTVILTVRLRLTPPSRHAAAGRGGVAAMEFTSAEGEQRYAALVGPPPTTVVGLDFDGTLAPIVDDPESGAHPPRRGRRCSSTWPAQVRAVAVVTGRPARQALDLGGLDEVGDAIGDAGKELYLFGQYGNERWSSTNRRVISPAAAARAGVVQRELPRVLRGADAADALVEEKGLAVAVHTRRLADPDAAFERLLPALGELAARHDLDRRARPAGDRGPLARHAQGPGRASTWSSELDAGGFVFVGDDLGDLEAFEAVARPAPSAACPPSWSARPPTRRAPCVDLSDVLVHGPDGVLDLLRQLTADAAALRA